MITIEQCRAARGLLDWTQQDLADACGLSKTAINNFEKGHSDIKSESLRAIRQAFESADIDFIEDGIRRKSHAAQILHSSAMAAVYDDICQKIQAGEEFLMIHLGNETFKTWEERVLSPLARINSEANVKGRILLSSAASQNISSYSHSSIRIFPNAEASLLNIFLYGDRVILEFWNASLLLLVDSPQALRAERMRFEHLWNAAQPMESIQRQRANTTS